MKEQFRLSPVTWSGGRTGSSRPCRPIQTGTAGGLAKYCAVQDQDHGVLFTRTARHPATGNEHRQSDQSEHCNMPVFLSYRNCTRHVPHRPFLPAVRLFCIQTTKRLRLRIIFCKEMVLVQLKTI